MFTHILNVDCSFELDFGINSWLVKNEQLQSNGTVIF